MTAVCPWCHAIAPAGAGFCPNCGRQMDAGNLPGTQQSQWQQSPWQMQQRRNSAWVPWVIGCAVVLALGFVTLVIIGLIVAASTQPTHQQQRRTTTHRVSRQSVETKKTSRIARGLPEMVGGRRIELLTSTVSM